MNVLLPDELRLTASQMAAANVPDFAKFYVSKEPGLGKGPGDTFVRVQYHESQVVPADSPMGVFIQGLTKAEVAG